VKDLAPLRGSLSARLQPTAHAVGCILAPLRGYAGQENTYRSPEALRHPKPPFDPSLNWAPPQWSAVSAPPEICASPLVHTSGPKKNNEKESVFRGKRKSRHVKHRVIRHGQAVQCQHPEHRK